MKKRVVYFEILALKENECYRNIELGWYRELFSSLEKSKGFFICGGDFC